MATYNKTEEVYLQGKGKWARLINPDMKFPPGKWNVVLYPNPDSLEKLRELQGRGLKNKLAKDDDGWYCNLGRPVSRMYKGVNKPFTPPVVIDKDGAPFNDPVGNGSDLTIKLEVYEHGTPGGGKAVAARLEKVRVDNLVPFKPDVDYKEDEAAEVAGIRIQPEQLF